MSEQDTTLRDEEIVGESSWQETKSEVADADGDDQDTTDSDTDDTDSDSDDTDADSDDTDPS